MEPIKFPCWVIKMPDNVPSSYLEKGERIKCNNQKEYDEATKKS